jgi:hypothetical protein
MQQLKNQINVGRHLFALFFGVSLLSACGGGGGAEQSANAPQPNPAPAPASGPAPAPSGTPPVNAGYKIYYVRIDGGTSNQCTGLADAPYSGTGQAQACAWSSPMVALPSSASFDVPGIPRISGGDTLYIRSGEYMIGLGAPGAQGCSSDFPWDCVMAALPAGPNAATPTRLLGEGHNTGCASAPQLWGTERAGHVLSLAGSNNVEVSCLEITDHAACVEGHSGAQFACKRDQYPYGRWAATGIVARDAGNVRLRHINVHGMANRGILAGRLNNWDSFDLRVAGNGWAGWDGDIGANTSSNSGTMAFTKWLVEWNGCVETYPGLQYTGCWGDSVGGYGDGVGTANTGGNWVIKDSVFQFNTSDGLDLLYNNQGGSVTLERVLAQGNAGNQLKTKGATRIVNSVVLGNCAFFNGKPFTYGLDSCRALGDALSVEPSNATDRVDLINNTIASEGNVIISTSGLNQSGARLTMRNNILVGLPYFYDPQRQSGDTYQNGGQLVIDESHSIKQNLHSVRCTSPSTICAEAGLVEASRSTLNPRLTPTSRARGTGVLVPNLTPINDFFGNPRPSGNVMDIGAVQMPR